MGIITAAILLVIGYVVLTKVIGLAFRLVVPVVLIAILAGAGVFTDLLPSSRSGPYPAGRDQPYRPHPVPEDGNRLGDIRLGDIADAVVAAAQSLLRGTLAFLDRAADPRASEQSAPDPDSRHRPRFRHDEGMPAYDDPQSWGPDRSGRTY